MKDLISLLSNLLAQHAWIKYALEITLPGGAARGAVARMSGTDSVNPP